MASSNTTTKSDLASMEERIDTKLSLQKDEIIEATEEIFTKYKSEFFEKIDPILKEVQDNREERVLTNARLTTIEEKLQLA